MWYCLGWCVGRFLSVCFCRNPDGLVKHDSLSGQNVCAVMTSTWMWHCTHGKRCQHLLRTDQWNQTIKPGCMKHCCLWTELLVCSAKLPKYVRFVAVFNFDFLIDSFLQLRWWLRQMDRLQRRLSDHSDKVSTPPILIVSSHSSWCRNASELHSVQCVPVQHFQTSVVTWRMVFSFKVLPFNVPCCLSELHNPHKNSRGRLQGLPFNSTTTQITTCPLICTTSGRNILIQHWSIDAFCSRILSLGQQTWNTLHVALLRLSTASRACIKGFGENYSASRMLH